jgi:hypothetical protein
MEITYYLSLKPHEDNRYYIHSEDCPLLPAPEKRIFLGRFASPEEAIKAAGSLYDNITFCRFCQIESVNKIYRLLKEKLPENTDFITSGMIISNDDTVMMCCIN